MAVTKTVLKNTNQEAVVKIGGTGAADTITLDSDILSASQVLDGATQTVNIVKIINAGAIGSKAVITRGATEVCVLTPESQSSLLFNDYGFVDSQANTDDVTVTISGAEAYVYIILHKVGGYKTKVEEATFSIYDDPNAAGS